MLRLASRLLATEPRYLFGWNSDLSAKSGITLHRAVDLLNKTIVPIVNRIKHCPVVIADGVNDPLFNSPRCLREFPGVKLPFESMFIETSDGNFQQGWMCHQSLNGTDEFETTVDMIDDMEKSPSLVLNMKDQGQSIRDVSDRISQCIKIYMFVSKNGDAFFTGVRAFYFSDKDGTILHNSLVFDVTCESYDRLVKSGHSLMAPAIFAISLMNCKNVVSYDVTDKLGPSEKWLRRQKQPKLLYRILDINPMKEVLRTDGNVAENGIKRAMHICRGHFKTYTEDSPLFGRDACTVWCPSHVRGDIKHGAVVKDYRVDIQK